MMQCVPFPLPLNDLSSTYSTVIFLLIILGWKLLVMQKMKWQVAFGSRNLEALIWQASDFWGAACLLNIFIMMRDINPSCCMTRFLF